MNIDCIFSFEERDNVTLRYIWEEHYSIINTFNEFLILHKKYVSDNQCLVMNYRNYELYWYRIDYEPEIFNKVLSKQQINKYINDRFVQNDFVTNKLLIEI